MLRYLLLPLCALLLFGCEQQKDKLPEVTQVPPIQAQSLPDVPHKPVILLKDPLNAVLVETPSEAIPTWRKYRDSRPTLVVLSNNPFLTKLPPELKDQTNTLVLHGSALEIREKASRPHANPLFFPQIAVTAALQADLVSEVIWVLPIQGTQEKIDFATFKKQLVDQRIMTAKETETLKQTADAIVGTLYGHPFRTITLGQLPKLSGPILLHIDLSFFAPLYRHEIGTPLYPLIFQILSKLQGPGWPTLALTISSSNLVGGMPLDTRFLAPDLQQLFAVPERLAKPIPTDWKQRAEALYLANFFKNEEIQAKYLKMQTEAPDDPSIKYALFQSERELKQGNQSLKSLAAAAALDPAYGQAYLDLVQVALKAKRPDAALQMLDKAAALFPENPFIDIKRAEILSTYGKPEETIQILARLKKLVWSPIYYPDMPAFFQSLSDEAQKNQKILSAKHVPAPEVKVPKQMVDDTLLPDK
ncbi:tetratricopeptide repeat protein [Geopsychrobacter electrodiphilus]|uniref:tetratricopeptide repeat protein n=1 Tax=Geopsychrobacter electrodiphilus TaxID=225196 RepID=UPI000370E922|nr:tetratricopeptide repeat protein [Geopsychrobacter electrodiphilus]